MRNSTYRRILYFIGFVILITLGIQIYWTYQNYQAGKQQLINEVQISLDNAVEGYYASGAQRKTRITLQNSNRISEIRPSAVNSDRSFDHTFSNIKSITVRKDTLRVGSRFEAVKIGSVKLLDSQDVKIIRTDTLNPSGMEFKVGQILYSMHQDTLDLKKMDSLVQQELSRKEINVDYGLEFNRSDNIRQKLNPEVIDAAPLKTESKSTWLPSHSSLSLYFTNGTATILKHNIVGILLSSILILSVIGCLLFLLKVINNQKQLAEIKNDFISNLTHEFKTPIATIKVAMEGIMFFNKNNDPQKTANYVKTSNDQVDKLNHMVEKLLEVATLSGNKLKLEKEEIRLVSALDNLVQRYQVMAPEKKFSFSSSKPNILLNADPFHLENAFNNILDNAVKYGGDTIEVVVAEKKDKVEIIFSDNGNTLTRAQANQIFEKFYRVPKGNTHDVKGFGIGLYYTRQIIERHGGNIEVDIKNNTRFLIMLPYE